MTPRDAATLKNDDLRKQRLAGSGGVARARKQAASKPRVTHGQTATKPRLSKKPRESRTQASMQACEQESKRTNGQTTKQASRQVNQA